MGETTISLPEFYSKLQDFYLRNEECYESLSESEIIQKCNPTRTSRKYWTPEGRPPIPPKDFLMKFRLYFIPLVDEMNRFTRNVEIADHNRRGEVVEFNVTMFVIWSRVLIRLDRWVQKDENYDRFIHQCQTIRNALNALTVVLRMCHFRVQGLIFLKYPEIEHIDAEKTKVYKRRETAALERQTRMAGTRMRGLGDRLKENQKIQMAIKTEQMKQMYRDEGIYWQLCRPWVKYVQRYQELYKKVFPPPQLLFLRPPPPEPFAAEDEEELHIRMGSASPDDLASELEDDTDPVAAMVRAPEFHQMPPEQPREYPEYVRALEPFRIAPQPPRVYPEIFRAPEDVRPIPVERNNDAEMIERAPQAFRIPPEPEEPFRNIPTTSQARQGPESQLGNVRIQNSRNSESPVVADPMEVDPDEDLFQEFFTGASVTPPEDVTAASEFNGSAPTTSQAFPSSAEFTTASEVVTTMESSASPVLEDVQGSSNSPEDVKPPEDAVIASEAPMEASGVTTPKVEDSENVQIASEVFTVSEFTTTTTEAPILEAPKEEGFKDVQESSENAIAKSPKQELEDVQTPAEEIEHRQASPEVATSSEFMTTASEAPPHDKSPKIENSEDVQNSPENAIASEDSALRQVSPEVVQVSPEDPLRHQDSPEQPQKSPEAVNSRKNSEERDSTESPESLFGLTSSASASDEAFLKDFFFWQPPTSLNPAPDVPIQDSESPASSGAPTSSNLAPELMDTLGSTPVLTEVSTSSQHVYEDLEGSAPTQTAREFPGLQNSLAPEAMDTSEAAFTAPEAITPSEQPIEFMDTSEPPESTIGAASEFAPMTPEVLPSSESAAPTTSNFSPVNQEPPTSSAPSPGITESAQIASQGSQSTDSLLSPDEGDDGVTGPTSSQEELLREFFDSPPNENPNVGSPEDLEDKYEDMEDYEELDSGEKKDAEVVGDPDSRDDDEEEDQDPENQDELELRQRFLNVDDDPNLEDDVNEEEQDEDKNPKEDQEPPTSSAQHSGLMETSESAQIAPQSSQSTDSLFSPDEGDDGITGPTSSQEDLLREFFDSPPSENPNVGSPEDMEDKDEDMKDYEELDSGEKKDAEVVGDPDSGDDDEEDQNPEDQEELELRQRFFNVNEDPNPGEDVNEEEIEEDSPPETMGTSEFAQEAEENEKIQNPDDVGESESNDNEEEEKQKPTTEDMRDDDVPTNKGGEKVENKEDEDSQEILEVVRASTSANDFEIETPVEDVEMQKIKEAPQVPVSRDILDVGDSDSSDGDGYMDDEEESNSNDNTMDRVPKSPEDSRPSDDVEVPPTAPEAVRDSGTGVEPETQNVEVQRIQEASRIPRALEEVGDSDSDSSEDDDRGDRDSDESESDGI